MRLTVARNMLVIPLLAAGVIEAHAKLAKAPKRRRPKARGPQR